MAPTCTIAASQAYSTATSSEMAAAAINYFASFTPRNLLIMILMPIVAFLGGIWLGLRLLRWMARNLSAHSIEVALEGRRDFEGVPEFFPPSRDVVWTPNEVQPDQQTDEKGHAISQ